MACHFFPLTVSFANKVIYFDEMQIIILLFNGSWFWSQRTLPNPRSWKFSLMHYSLKFYGFKIFVKLWGSGWSLFFLHTDVQFFRHHLLKGFSFSIKLLLHLCQKSNGHTHVSLSVSLARGLSILLIFPKSHTLFSYGYLNSQHVPNQTHCFPSNLLMLL